MRLPAEPAPSRSLPSPTAGGSHAVIIGMPRLTIITATGRREALDLAAADLTAAALQAAVARRLGLQPSAAAGLRLVRGGQPLADDEAVSRLKDGGECHGREVGAGLCRRFYFTCLLCPTCRRSAPPAVPPLLLQPVSLHLLHAASQTHC